ncbi:MFS transporter [Pseudomonas fluorescens]|uniref:MFS transporter n=1 Tax=Pseudomonas fluorescens TaxID=294 RepID=A0A1T2Y2I1_PSEFL|nr:MFS transporter [Pseudomonas fluorescens]OPA86340.1 MFS transporter [Pseudomonas fluorescens]
MHTQDSSWSELLRGKNGARSLALSGGIALYATNTYIATTILPSVVAEIGGLALYAWSTTLYVVASILGSALTSRLLQRTSPRQAYAVGTLIFMVGVLICAVAPSMPVMLVGRSIQGLGGGMLLALCYSMIQLVFEERLWPRAMALVSGMWGVATLVGPAVGGVFAEMDAWRFAFGSMVPVSLAYIVLTSRALPPRDTTTAATTRLPVAQLVLLAAAVLAVCAGSVSSLPSWNLLGIGACAVLVVLLIRKESRATVRLLPRDALKFSTPLCALYATTCLLVIGMSSEIFMPYFLQHLHGQSPLIAGYMAALMAAGWTVSEILSSGWTGRRAHYAILAGPLFIVVGLVVLALTTPIASHGEWARLAPICLGLFMVGFGIGLGWPHLLTRILQVASAQDKDTAASSITTLQLFAMALGAALAGVISNMAGINDSIGNEGASHAARLLFALFTLAPLLAWMMALRATRTTPLADGLTQP